MRLRPLIGRDGELAQLGKAVEAAAYGRGGVSFVCGEPGIGKSRLLEELAESVLDRGILTVWGRCWESGGAPAFWPWMCALRAMLRGVEPAMLRTSLGHRATTLAHLLPELRAQIPELPPPQAEGGQFELLDAICGALCDLSHRKPVLVLLEDLHMADASSLSVFDALGSQLKNSSVCVVATLRDADARLSQHRELLESALAQGRCLQLTRLDRAEVARFVVETAGHAPDETAMDEVYRATEGNPLFLTEVTRLLATDAAWAQVANAGIAIPGNIRHTLRKRLQTLSEPTRQALRVAAILGREFLGTTLASLWGRPMAFLSEPLHEALEAGILTEIAPGEYRFSHVLLCEVSHQELDDERRAALHAEAAELLEARGPRGVAWSEIAHHYLEAGATVREQAVRACAEAARAAAKQLAFFDARDWFRRALTAHGQDASTDLHRRARLLLELADTELHSGDIASGKRTCERAAELAREVDDPALFAQCALMYGSVLVFAAVDTALVALLQEALLRLDESHLDLRAVVTARLAAAEQPSAVPELPIDRAKAAIAMARDTGSAETWLETARYAVSAMMDLGEPAERLELNREYIKTADQLQKPLEVLRGRMRLVFDYFELGNVGRADLEIGAIEAAARELGHPFYAWRAHSFRAMSALFHGQGEAARIHWQAARDLDPHERDPNLARACASQQFEMAKLRAEPALLQQAAADVAEVYRCLQHGEPLAQLVLGQAVALSGSGARIELDGDIVETTLRMGDVSMLSALLAIGEHAGLRDLGHRVEARIVERDDVQFVSGGMLAMVWGEPVSLVLARAARHTLRPDAARERFAVAIEDCRAAHAEPYEAWASYELAELLLTHDTGAIAESTRLLDQAGELATRLDLSGLTQRVDVARARLDDRRQPALSQPQPSAVEQAAGARSSEDVELQSDGELWTLRCGTRQVRLKDSKGLQWLAALMQRPGQEVHVLDLVSPERSHDTSDAGELLDAEAINAYKSRLRELERSLDEAEEFNDLARATQLREEREFLQHELRRALGLHGKPRRAGAAAERARVNVQRRLRDALTRIGRQDAELATRLERSLTTGSFCLYRP
jgi:hypothetical protein